MLDLSPRATSRGVKACRSTLAVLSCRSHVSRSSFARTGIYISNRASDKMARLSDNAIMCRSGSAADTEAVAGYVRHYVEQHAMELGGTPDVKLVATVANQINYQNKGANQGQGLGAYMIIGGWDPRRGPQVFSCTAGGNMVKTNWTTDGSGSTFIWG